MPFKPVCSNHGSNVRVHRPYWINTIRAGLISVDRYFDVAAARLPTKVVESENKIPFLRLESVIDTSSIPAGSVKVVDVCCW